MPGDCFWDSIEALAATFDGKAKAAEEDLQIYTRHCLEFSGEKRAAVRRQLIQIIGGLHD